MELERRYVNLNHRKGEAFSQMTMEEDLNVPDQKPDIYKIIHGQGEFRPDEIKGETGKIKVRGIFLYRILYISENVDRMPEMLEGSVPVDETVFLNGLEEGDMLDVSWKQEDFRVSAVHSRKANMKCVLSFSAEAYREQPVPLLEQPEAAEDLYLKTSPVSLKQEMLHKKDTVRVREDVTISPGKPNIRRILWREVRLQGAEARQEDGKILVKGELAVSPPKTKAGNRTVLLPAPVLNVLKTYKQAVHSRWMFPSPVKEDSPMDPAAVRKRLQTVLERAEYNRLHFHGLRHTFATTALQNGVHVRIVSSMPGHYDTGFTLRTYPHTAKQTQDEAAQTMGAFMEQVM